MPITLSTDLWLKWGLKQSYSPCQEISNSMWHATFTQRNQGDSWLLVVKSQIGHNLCFKCSNGSCEPILNIYIPRDFQWCKELFNPMRFDPCNRLLKIWKSVEIPIPKVRAHLGVWGSFPHTFLHSSKHEMWLSSFAFNSHLYQPLLWSRAQG